MFPSCQVRATSIFQLTDFTYFHAMHFNPLKGILIYLNKSHEWPGQNFFSFSLLFSTVMRNLPMILRVKGLKWFQLPLCWDNMPLWWGSSSFTALSLKPSSLDSCTFEIYETLSWSDQLICDLFETLNLI